ncbi:MAG: hypothetical protein P1P85_05505 [Patescibacteria group bacterium]|nr:hypothetical protein [Patescibacteria group bacterium]
MPVEAQLLYFHFVLRADDDGIVEAYPIMRLLGIAPDNFKILVAKNFIEILNEDQVIVILDWLEHNKIRADRKVNSIYIDLLKNRHPEISLVQPKPRTDVKDNSKRLYGQSTDSISKDKLSKDKLSKDKLIHIAATQQRCGNNINLLIEKFKSINPSYDRLYANTTQRKALERLIKKYTSEKVGAIIDALPEIVNQKYAPIITDPLSLEKKLGQLLIFIQQNKKQKGEIIL